MGLTPFSKAKLLISETILFYWPSGRDKHTPYIGFLNIVLICVWINMK